MSDNDAGEASARSTRVWRRRRKFFVGVLVIGVFIHYASLVSLYWLPEYASRRTYMSENALQPSQGHITYNQRQLSRGVKWSANSTRAACTHIEKIGLKCHQFGDGVVYTVARAPKCDGKEALLVSTTMESFGVTLSLFHHLSTQKWLARDIFLVVSERNDAQEIHSWFKCYMGECDLELIGARGRFEVAINVDIGKSALSSKRFDYVVIEAPSVMSGGSLPNLDLLNTFVSLCHSQRLHDTRLMHPFLPDVVPAPMRQFVSFLLQFIWSGTTQSNVQGALNRYQVEAITVSTEGGSAGAMSLLSFMRALEGTFRSLNNLQERLHQSFYFYVLTAAQGYISIADYMIPFGGALFVLPVRMLSEYYDPGFTSDLLRGSIILSVYCAGGLLMFALHSASWAALLARHLGLSLVCLGAAPSLATRDYGVKTVTLMLVTLFCITASLVNWPLAMISAALLVPTLTFVRPSGGYLQLLLLLCVDPGVVYLLAGLYLFPGSAPPPLIWALITCVYWPAHRAMLHTTLK